MLGVWGTGRGGLHGQSCLWGATGAAEGAVLGVVGKTGQATLGIFESCAKQVQLYFEKAPSHGHRVTCPDFRAVTPVGGCVTMPLRGEPGGRAPGTGQGTQGGPQRREALPRRPGALLRQRSDDSLHLPPGTASAPSKVVYLLESRFVACVCTDFCRQACAGAQNPLGCAPAPPQSAGLCEC